MSVFVGVSVGVDVRVKVGVRLGVYVIVLVRVNVGVRVFVVTKTILAVLAHPDDETFGLGGTLTLYSQKGYDVYYLCATRGEAGSADAEFMKGFKDTAEMRTDELMRATKILGLKGVYFLGYRDSGMPGTEENKHPDAQINHSIDEVAGRIVKHIRELIVDETVVFFRVALLPHFYKVFPLKPYLCNVFEFREIISQCRRNSHRYAGIKVNRV